MQQSLRAVEPHKGKTAALSHDWPVYGGQKANDHYSPLAQINRSNVGRLKVAWTYDTGEKGVGLQASPLIVGRTLYAYTPSQKVIADVYVIALDGTGFTVTTTGDDTTVQLLLFVTATV